MPKIKVNHNSLIEIADEIEAYCDEQDREMLKVNAKVAELFLTGWVGNDAKEFTERWQAVDDPNSITYKFKTQLKDYAKYLRSSSERYRKVQEDVYNMAKKLPR